ncbi:biopolymer transport protein ExbD [Malonomonas rubra DSM 5091]|uniref:Biopolymer transport protein ExbD n=1 Tax=Malonomonas rubra DSM 5091 TaxID=1122189 RepID=A0A1M6B5J8_MALRU|nr:biopolymer transporter ExbD [Malonomonas rubra]SHI43848.1 biopolymer transport protein ExbD [Malonomonas rubra DSM 5091]
MGFKRRSFDSPRVDLTPMIDVVFLLLIFFMISTTFIEKPGMKIDLPEASMQHLNSEDKEVQVYLTADGQIFLQREPVTLAQLADHLSTYGVAGKQMTFMLMADKDALHGKVIALMDLAKTAGFGKLAIATDKEKDKVDE